MKFARTILATLVGAMITSAGVDARADHNEPYVMIRAHADEIVDASRDLSDVLRYRFHDSRLYGELLTTNARIRGKANSLSTQARPSRNGEWIPRLLGELNEEIYRMDLLIDEAKYRSARGMDRPIGSTRSADQLVAQMREAVRCLERELSIRPAPNAHDHLGDWRSERYGRGLGGEIRIDRGGLEIRAGKHSVYVHR